MPFDNSKKQDENEEIPFEARLALGQFELQNNEVRNKKENSKKMKIYAVLIFLINTYFANIILLQLGWPSLAIEKITGLGILGLIVIFFNKSIGSHNISTWPLGPIWRRVDKETPAEALVFFGWVLIFLPIIVAFLNYINK